ncbi:nuclear envelope integral membrane protein 1 [Tachyglossus aculeatus]|uniref:nuclear envelope integral membrane protein 1 n=1 Tax=Tachyglossus aculeatus TaxID=9261 RepID=UPI0018F69E7F|nr:nuclear envelope integral membrane protein 1 [Tachyglossus aculeatus]
MAAGGMKVKAAVATGGDGPRPRREAPAAVPVGGARWRLLLLVCCGFPCGAAGAQEQVLRLREAQTVQQTGSRHFCYHSTLLPRWYDVWTRVQIRVNSSKAVRITQADSEEKLRELEQSSVWNFFSSFVKEKLNDTYISVDLHSQKTCLQVEVLQSDTIYSVSVARGFNSKLFLVFLLGVLLFFCGDVLSRSQLFFYSTGVSVGVLASLLIAIFLLSRLVPKKSPLYVILLGGWSFSLYLIQLIFRNLHEICNDHWQYLLGYVLVVGFISFAVCYSHGPLQHERSINLLTWALQLSGLALIYISVQLRPVALALVAGALATRILEYPLQWLHATYRRMRNAVAKPVPPQLLTEEEYRLQGEVETRRALEDLRSLCSSPDFRPWKTIARIQSPKRFADFVEGSFHLTPNEVSVHEQEYGLGSAFAEEELFEDFSIEDDEPLEPLEPLTLPDLPNHLGS